MAFKFSLATLLRLREIAEQREERLLGQIQNQIAQSRLMLDELAIQRQAIFRQRELALDRTISAVDLTNSYAQARAIEVLEENGRDQISKLLELRAKQMNIYQTASRNSKVLSEMCDGQKNDFDKEQSKQEQSTLDDSFSSRRRYK